MCSIDHDGEAVLHRRAMAILAVAAELIVAATAAVLIMFIALLVCFPLHAYSLDRPEFGAAPPQIREWFRSIKSPLGVPCCDVADGHRTDYDMRGNDYWVPINGVWMAVPKEAVVPDARNPTGDAVVWYSNFGDHVVIRCFVPGGGA